MAINLKKLQDSLYSYYRKSHMPVWIYNQNLELCFTNFTTPVLLHLMDVLKPLVRNYIVASAVDGYRLILDYPFETYYAFTLPISKRTNYTVLVGPVLPAKPTERIWDQFSFRKAVFEDQRPILADLLPVSTLEVFLHEISEFLQKYCEIVPPDFSSLLRRIPRNEKLHDELQYSAEACRSRYTGFSVSALHEKEECLRYYIRKGNIYRLYLFLQDEKNQEFLFPMRSSLQECIIRATELMTIARLSALEGGYGTDPAYYLYSTYAEQIHNCKNIGHLIELTGNCLCEYSNCTHRISTYTKADYSPLVNKCIQKIIERMPDKITLEELADEIHLSPKYLSALFNKETGSSITDFMQDMRIDEAKRLLQHSDLGYLEISNLLNFSSQSYFNCIFKKKTGLTPKEYRMQNCNTDTVLLN